MLHIPTLRSGKPYASLDKIEVLNHATGEKLIEVDENGAQHPAKTQVLKPDWQKVQGPPAVHFALAKSLGYDFYITTDHSQEAAFQPPGPPGHTPRPETQHAITLRPHRISMVARSLRQRPALGPPGPGFD